MHQQGMPGMGMMNHDRTNHDMSDMMEHDSSAPSASTSTTMQAAVYTCVMHPDVISDKPGKCPKCGMQLVLKKGARR